MGVFKKIFSYFRNGNSYAPIKKSEPKDFGEPWEIEESVDSAILSEIESDFQDVIETFRNLNVHLMVLNEDFRIVFVSEILLKLIEYTRDRLLGKELSFLIPEPFTESQKMELSGEIGAITAFKNLILKTGENIPAQIYVQTIRGTGLLCYTVIVVPMGGKKSF